MSNSITKQPKPKHIDYIINTLEPLMNEGTVSYKDLPISCQMRVLNSRIFACDSQIKWWTPHIDDESKNDEFRARAQSEVDAYTNSMKGMLQVIKAAAEMHGDGVETEVGFDSHYIDEQGNTTGELVHEKVMVTGNPYAWVRNNIETSLGINFDDIEADFEAQFHVPDIERVFAKAAATYIAQLILAEAGAYSPPTSERGLQYVSDTILLAANSATLHRVKKSPNIGKSLLQMLSVFDNFPLKQVEYEDNVAITRTYSRAQLVDMWNMLAETDDETLEAEQQVAEAVEAKQQTKDMVKNINQVTRDVIFKTTVASQIGQSAATMKKAGLSDELIASISGQMMQVFLPTPAPAPAPAVETEAVTQ